MFLACLNWHWLFCSSWRWCLSLLCQSPCHLWHHLFLGHHWELHCHLHHFEEDQVSHQANSPRHIHLKLVNRRSPVSSWDAVPYPPVAGQWYVALRCSHVHSHHCPRLQQPDCQHLHPHRDDPWPLLGDSSPNALQSHPNTMCSCAGHRTSVGTVHAHYHPCVDVHRFDASARWRCCLCSHSPRFGQWHILVYALSVFLGFCYPFGHHLPGVFQDLATYVRQRGTAASSQFKGTHKEGDSDGGSHLPRFLHLLGSLLHPPAHSSRSAEPEPSFLICL